MRRDDRRQQPLVDLALAAGAWILDAADAFLWSDLVEAAVVAGDAAAHQIGAAAARLFRRPGIGDKLPRHADEVGLAARSASSPKLRRIHPAEGDDRQAAHVLQFPVDPAEIFRRHGGGRDFHPVAGKRAGIGIEIVDEAARLEMLGHLQAVFAVVAEGGELVDAQPDAERHVIADRLPDRLEHLDRQPHAVFESAAIARRCGG